MNHTISPVRFQDILHQSKTLVHLAWPLFIALVTQVFMGVADTIMAGHYSSTDMAAIAVGVSLINPIQFFLQGVALALIPLVANAIGEAKPAKIANHFQHMLVIVVLFSIACMGVSVWLDEILAFFAVPDEMLAICKQYTTYMLWGLPGFAIYQVIRQTCEGLSMTKPTMLIMVFGLSLNIPLNAIFIYGLGPIPEFGGAGCGISSLIVYCAMAVATLGYARRNALLKSLTLWQKPRWQIAEFVHLLKLGIPISLTLLAEVTLFAAVALLIAPLGTLQVAAHQIAINFSSLVFMLPLSVGMATAIRIGRLDGKRDTHGCRATYYAAVLLTSLLAIMTAVMTVMGSQQLVKIYTSDASIWPLAVQILWLGALFQISDAVQVCSGNALRGYKDTNWLFGISFTSYWIISLPLGYILTLTDIIIPAMGVQGFWLAIIVGLSVAALAYFVRLRFVHQQRRHQHQNTTKVA
jgi:MATE family multidrug resistance protein